MTCPTCQALPMKGVIENDQGTFRWCRQCGTICTFSGSVLVPRLASQTDAGLSLVAADSVRRANKVIEQWAGIAKDDHDLLRFGVPQVLEHVTEAIVAIIHELDAREREPTAAERQDMRAVIAAGVHGIELERERIACLVEAYRPGPGDALTYETRRTLLDRIAKNIRTNRVPQ